MDTGHCAVTLSLGDQMHLNCTTRVGNVTSLEISMETMTLETYARAIEAN
jgi:hypothetical protein